MDEESHGTVATSPTESTSSESNVDDLVCPEADPDDTSLHEFPTNHAGIVREIQRAQRTLPEDVATEEPARSPPSRKGSGLSTLTTPLPDVQEEEPEILVMISDSEDASPVAPSSKMDKQKLFNHSHGPAHHHRHVKRGPTEDETKEKKPNNETASSHERSNLSDLGNIFFGIGFAAVVAVGAFVLYSTGIMGQHDVVKDGGAALGS